MRRKRKQHVIPLVAASEPGNQSQPESMAGSLSSLTGRRLFTRGDVWARTPDEDRQ